MKVGLVSTHKGGGGKQIRKSSDVDPECRTIVAGAAIGQQPRHMEGDRPKILEEKVHDGEKDASTGGFNGELPTSTSTRHTCYKGEGDN